MGTEEEAIKKDKFVGFRCDEVEYGFFKFAAEEWDCTMSEAVRQLSLGRLYDYLVEQQVKSTKITQTLAKANKKGIRSSRPLNVKHPKMK